MLCKSVLISSISLTRLATFAIPILSAGINLVMGCVVSSTHLPSVQRVDLFYAIIGKGHNHQEVMEDYYRPVIEQYHYLTVCI